MAYTSQSLTSFIREYIIGDGNNVGYGFSYKVKIDGSTITFEFGQNDKKTIYPLPVSFQNELFIYNGSMEILTIKYASKIGTEIKLTAHPPFYMEQIFAMIGAGFGVFTLRCDYTILKKQ